MPAALRVRDVEVVEAVVDLHRGEHRAERDQRGVGLEHDRRRGAVDPDLRPLRDDDRVDVPPRQLEGQLGPRRLRGGRLDPEELEELHVVQLGNLVDAVEERLGHPREELEQRDPGIAVVVVRPLGRVPRDAGARLLEEVVEGAVVEERRRERHQPPIPSWM